MSASATSGTDVPSPAAAPSSKLPTTMSTTEPLGLFIQPACLQHRYIRHANASHIFERPERLRAVLLGVAAAAARLEGEDAEAATAALTPRVEEAIAGKEPNNASNGVRGAATGDELSAMLSSLAIATSGSGSGAGAGAGAGGSAASLVFDVPAHLEIVHPPTPPTLGQILLHHPALQLAHSPPSDTLIPYLPSGGISAGTRRPALPSSAYLRELLKWATDAPERIKETGCEIPPGLGLNQGDLYLGPGSVLAIEGAVQTVCQAVDRVFEAKKAPGDKESMSPSKTSQGQHETAVPVPTVAPSTPPAVPRREAYFGAGDDNDARGESSRSFRKAFCAIRPPGHHCGEDAPSGFCYVNNVVVGAMHGMGYIDLSAYLEHDVDRAIIIDFDLHHGNGTQALVMPLNAATHAEELAVKVGKPPTGLKGRDGRPRRGWKGFYGSVHDIYSYPCEDGDLDLVKDASLSLAAHGQYIENIHLQPYTSEADFYTRIYPLYLALLSKARAYLFETDADPARTVLFVSAGFDACEHEHAGMQRHDRRVPVSFFARYTADIARFADEHCGGRVVSVLEGGYSDRALTSAAMGHVCGMLGREGRGEWWTEQELGMLERATKKKRTGRLHPFPAELNHLPHLARAHALLGHFEGVGLSVGVGAPAHAPSVTSTPTHIVPSASGRMTLRARKVAEDGTGEAVTPPRAAPSRRGRGRGVGGGAGVGESRTGTPTRAGAGASDKAEKGPGTPIRGKGATPARVKAETPVVKSVVEPPIGGSPSAHRAKAVGVSSVEEAAGKQADVDGMVGAMARVGLSAVRLPEHQQHSAPLAAVEAVKVESTSTGVNDAVVAAPAEADKAGGGIVPVPSGSNGFASYASMSGDAANANKGVQPLAAPAPAAAFTASSSERDGKIFLRFSRPGTASASASASASTSGTSYGGSSSPPAMPGGMAPPAGGQHGRGGGREEAWDARAGQTLVEQRGEGLDSVQREGVGEQLGRLEQKQGGGDDVERQRAGLYPSLPNHFQKPSG